MSVLEKFFDIRNRIGNLFKEKSSLQNLIFNLNILSIKNKY